MESARFGVYQSEIERWMSERGERVRFLIKTNELYVLRLLFSQREFNKITSIKDTSSFFFHKALRRYVYVSSSFIVVSTARIFFAFSFFFFYKLSNKANNLRVIIWCSSCVLLSKISSTISLRALFFLVGFFYPKIRHTLPPMKCTYLTRMFSWPRKAFGILKLRKTF